MVGGSEQNSLLLDMVKNMSDKLDKIDREVAILATESHRASGLEVEHKAVRRVVDRHEVYWRALFALFGSGAVGAALARGLGWV